MVVAGLDAVSTLRTRVAGTIRLMVSGDRRPPSRAPDVDGLFGPESATWQVHADLAMFVGGLRALLLQTMHPLAMAGVAEHSDYRDDPWGRLRRTGQFVGITTFGSEAEALAMIERVRRIHDHVSGTAPDGRTYEANDPHLLAWVHVTEVDSFLRAYQRYGQGSLSSSDADRYVAEMAVVARLLGADDVPESVAEIDAFFQRVRPELTVTREAREAVGFLLAPPVALAARPAYAVISAAAIGLLPPWARRKLWLPVAPLSDPVLVRPAARALLGGLHWALHGEQTAS
jgi:uncharacterized protein (DUF2236 family)